MSDNSSPSTPPASAGPPSEKPTAQPAIPIVPAHPAISHRSQVRRTLILGAAAIVVIGLVIVAVPWISRALSTVSTDDAYVNGHVTFVAARVPGQVQRVLVDDNNRVHTGDLLLQLDPAPYQVLVDQASAAVASAQADLAATRAGVRAEEAKAHSQRFNLEHSIEQVDNQIAVLHANVAVLGSAKAQMSLAEADYQRGLSLVNTGALAREEFEHRQESLAVAQAQVESALQQVYQTRVGLGLPDKPNPPDDLTQVPADLDQTFSSVRQAQNELVQTVSDLGVFDQPLDITPREMVARFLGRDPSGDIDKIYAGLLEQSPAVKQALTKVQVAQRTMDQAQLNLSYCNVYAEIDGVVTRRNVNPGNNIIAGQSVMAVRSLTDIWIDANFKETQLADLRIGQSVDLDVDLYGSHKSFKGRISGFTMGTGSTLALLPPENATGNYVKVVQRLPVRIDLINYDPEHDPLFIGLSVTPYVQIGEPLSGPDAGGVFQPYMPATRPDASPATQPTTLGLAR